jgi:hypothetical protein
MLARRDFRALLRALFEQRDQEGSHQPINLDSLVVHPLGGGYSRSYVALVWLDGLPTLVVKAGPEDRIRRETQARAEYVEEGDEGFKTLKELGLTGCSEPREVDANDREEFWRAMAYRYAGSLTYEGIRRYTDFEVVFNDFVAPRDPADRPSSSQLEDWLKRLFEQVAKRTDSDESSQAPQGIRSKPLAEFLPTLRWEDGLEAVLTTATTFAPQADDLRGFRQWWEDAVQQESLAPYANLTRLHGDLHFNNVFVNRSEASVELIDFELAEKGHVFRDLARFECDLLFRISPPPIETRTLRRSTEERRTQTLELAFGPNFYPPDPDPEDERSDPTNPQAAALRLLRRVYDRQWHINNDPGRQRMYLWFLLAEVLKRLLWIGSVFGTEPIRLAMMQSVVMLRRSIQGGTTSAPGFASAAGLSREMGLQAASIPTQGFESVINRDRNDEKVAALRRAASRGETVRLIAETGHSYFYFRGPFFKEIADLLESRGQFQVGLINPYFVESHGVSAAFLQSDKLDEDGLHPQVHEKLGASLAGYQNLKSKARDRLMVKVARYRLNGTVLLTDEHIFFEPYFHSDRNQRWMLSFDTFELRFDGRNEHTRRLFNSEFNFHWANSTPIDEIMKRDQDFKALLRQLTALW